MSLVNPLSSEAGPIAFGNVKPDIQLLVFNSQFQVHSQILKLHSVFFRSFFKLSDVDRLGVQKSGGFRCTCLTKVDEEKSWTLESQGQHITHAKLNGAGGNQGDIFEDDYTEERTAFEKLLNAMYSRPFQIASAAELELVTKLAEYFQALPILSFALSRALQISTGFLETLYDDSARVIIAAYKLHHAPLFRECLIYVLGPWDKPEFETIEHEEIQQVALRARNALSVQLLDAQMEVLSQAFWKSQSGGGALVLQCTHDDLSRGGHVSFPKLMRRIHTTALDLSLDVPILISLMENKLVFGQSSIAGGEYDLYDDPLEDHFLCTKIGDEELPWDPNQLEW